MRTRAYEKRLTGKKPLGTQSKHACNISQYGQNAGFEIKKIKNSSLGYSSFTPIAIIRLPFLMFTQHLYLTIKIFTYAIDIYMIKKLNRD